MIVKQVIFFSVGQLGNEEYNNNIYNRKSRIMFFRSNLRNYYRLDLHRRT